MPRGLSDLLLAVGVILIAAGLTAVLGHVGSSVESGWYDGWHSDSLTIFLGVLLLCVSRAGRRHE